VAHAIIFLEIKGLDCIVCKTQNLANSDCDNGKTSFNKTYKKSCPSGSKCVKSTTWYYKNEVNTSVSR